MADDSVTHRRKSATFFYLWFNIFWTDFFEVPTIRLTKNEGALFSPPFCLLFFLSLRAFFCAHFPPFFFSFNFFCLQKPFFGLKACLSRILSALLFFWERPLFSFLVSKAIFSALFFITFFFLALLTLPTFFKLFFIKLLYSA